MAFTPEDLRIDYVPDWGARLRSRLYEQFKDRPRFKALCTHVLGPQFQDLEDAAQGALVLRSIDAGSGFVLDWIGVIVGQSRGGTDDSTYKKRLRARVRANRSSGRPEDLYAIYRFFFDDDAFGMIYVPEYPASFDLVLKTPILASDVDSAAEFLGSAKADGVKGILRYQRFSNSEIFEYAPLVRFLTADKLAGVTLLPVGSTSGFPITGQVVIDQGTSREETRGYDNTGAGGATFVLTSPTAFPHDLHTAIALVEAPPQGFPKANTTVAAMSVGATTVNMTKVWPTGYPTSGTIQIDGGTSRAEELPFTASVGFADIHFGHGVAFAHDARTALAVIGTGGRYAGAAEGEA